MAEGRHLEEHAHTDSSDHKALDMPAQAQLNRATGLALRLHQFRAMLIKRYLYSLRNKNAIMTQVCKGMYPDWPAVLMPLVLDPSTAGVHVCSLGSCQVGSYDEQRRVHITVRLQQLWQHKPASVLLRHRRQLLLVYAARHPALTLIHLTRHCV